MFTLSREFFDLPDEQKAPYMIDYTRTGYVGSFKDKSDLMVSLLII
jgi:isopenicillin N synthase-like dioxygenase